MHTQTHTDFKEKEEEESNYQQLIPVKISHLIVNNQK